MARTIVSLNTLKNFNSTEELDKEFSEIERKRNDRITKIKKVENVPVENRSS